MTKKILIMLVAFGMLSFNLSACGNKEVQTEDVSEIIEKQESDDKGTDVSEELDEIEDGIQLGSSIYKITGISGFTNNTLSEEDIIDSKVLSMTSKEYDLTFDVYETEKTASFSLDEHANEFAILYGAEYVDITDINDIDMACFDYTNDTYSGRMYICSDEDSVININFIAKDETGVEKADAIIQTISEMELVEYSLGKSPYSLELNDMFFDLTDKAEGLDENQIGYYYNKNLVLNVYEYDKGTASLDEFANSFAAEYGAEYVDIMEYNGIDYAMYSGQKDVDGNYDTATYIFGDNDKYYRLFFIEVNPHSDMIVERIFGSISK